MQPKISNNATQIADNRSSKRGLLCATIEVQGQKFPVHIVQTSSLVLQKPSL